MTSGALVVLEQSIALNLLGANGIFFALQIAVERTIRREQSFFILGDGVGDGVLVEAFGVNGEEALGKLGIGWQGSAWRSLRR